MAMSKGLVLVCVACSLSGLAPASEELTEQERRLAAGHPRPSYRGVEDIDAMAAALRKQLRGISRQSFSRGWWGWDRLRARFVDGGRVAKSELKILRAVFRAWILDWHAGLEARGEGDLFYIFFVTTAPGNKTLRQLNGRQLVRDVHGGGYHGGWGGAARMRVYQELADGGMLSEAEKRRFRKIVFQSLDARFLDFRKGAQSANNHSFGNAGGVALALRLFPDAPQADEARAWLDRIWANLADFGDWKEWTYYPYGPIFLHGLLDIAEATGRIETERELIRAVGRRALDFIHGGGVRGNPNSGARVRKEREPLYADPWNVGYYDIEQSARDGHFWYRMARHFEDPQYLWAAEQVNLGGRPPDGGAPAGYKDAYERRFAWFVERKIAPRLPRSRASVGHLGSRQQRIPERLFLNAGRDPGRPFAAFFLYDRKDAHLDNVSGHLYEYSVGGAKLLHTSGKYNNVYSGDKLRGGGTGEESLDLLLVMKRRHPFPVHPDRTGDAGDHMRRGSVEHLPELLVARNNEEGDSFGQFGFDHYYGRGSRWIRRTVLTSEGCLVVADEYEAGKSLGSDYRAGPVWHLAVGAPAVDGPQEKSWFDAPALDRAWWQSDEVRVVLRFHDDGLSRFGSLRQSSSQDTDPCITTFACRPVTHGRTERFLSVLVPHDAGVRADDVVARVKTRITESGSFTASIGEVSVTIRSDGGWSVTR